jgi:hypothetical protein
MKRRDFIILVGGSTSAFTCAAAFAAKTMARIGLLSIEPLKEFTDLLTPALNALGWRDGETCQIEARGADGDIASPPRIARPGGNTTGTTTTPQILWGKRLELIAELLGHHPSKVAWIGNPDLVTAKRNINQQRNLGIKVELWGMRKPDDLERVFVATTGCEAILVQFIPLTYRYRRCGIEITLSPTTPQPKGSGRN